MKPTLSTSILLASLRWLSRVRYWLVELRDEPHEPAVRHGFRQAAAWCRASWSHWHQHTAWLRVLRDRFDPATPLPLPPRLALLLPAH